MILQTFMHITKMKLALAYHLWIELYWSPEQVSSRFTMKCSWNLGIQIKNKHFYSNTN